MSVNAKASLFGIPYSVASNEEQVNDIYAAAASGENGYVCVSNVHMLVETMQSNFFFNVLKGASFIVADGMPLVWLLRCKGHKDVKRLAGFDLTHALLHRASRDDLPIFFLGSTPTVLEGISDRITLDYPSLTAVDFVSPPFRELSDNETRSLINRINTSGAKIVFVAFGCPKQEIWMYENKNVV